MTNTIDLRSYLKDLSNNAFKICFIYTLLVADKEIQTQPVTNTSAQFDLIKQFLETKPSVFVWSKLDRINTKWVKSAGYSISSKEVSPEHEKQITYLYLYLIQTHSRDFVSSNLKPTSIVNDDIFVRFEVTNRLFPIHSAQGTLTPRSEKSFEQITREAIEDFQSTHKDLLWLEQEEDSRTFDWGIDYINKDLKTKSVFGLRNRPSELASTLFYFRPSSTNEKKRFLAAYLYSIRIVQGRDAFELINRKMKSAYATRKHKKKQNDAGLAKARSYYLKPETIEGLAKLSEISDSKPSKIIDRLVKEALKNTHLR